MGLVCGDMTLFKEFTGTLRFRKKSQSSKLALQGVLKVAAVWIEHTTQALSVDVVSYPFNRALANLDFPLQIA
jgi:hypothetical protein